MTGANKGIGKAIALKLAENGADIVVHGRERDSSEGAVRQIEEMGRRAAFEAADLLDYAEVKAMVDRGVSRFGRIDILVANGAAQKPGQLGFFEKIEPTRYMEFLSVPIIPRLNCVRAVFDHMKERRYGKIVLIVSDAGRVPTPAESLLGASNAGMIFATKVLAREFLRYKIRINAIATTVTADTPGFEFAMSGEAKAVFEKAVSRIPLGINKPGQLADAALYFASEESDQITGQTLSINGGLSFPG